MVAREPLSQNSPLVDLTGRVLSYIILKAETADIDIKSSPLFGLKITVGDREFKGMDEERVVENFLRWLIEKEPTLTKEDYHRIGGELEAGFQENIDELADKYAEGGMTEFGQVVEEARDERRGIIERALRECDLSGERVEVILEEVRVKTQLGDLDLAEVIECIHRMKGDGSVEELPDAMGAVAGSTDKPN